MSKIKVTFVETNCKKNGPIKQTLNIIRNMDKEVFEPSLVTVWPEDADNSMIDEYKKLDKLCSEMYGKNSGGVTCYLNDMMAVPVMQRNRIPEWNQTYDRLRELRHIRNQMAHGESSFEDYPCSEEDVLWLFEFRSKIMHISDPLAVYRRQTEGSTCLLYTSPSPRDRG